MGRVAWLYHASDTDECTVRWHDDEHSVWRCRKWKMKEAAMSAALYFSNGLVADIK